MTQLTTEILLEEIEFFAHHGITKEERDKGNTFIVDVSVQLKTNAFSVFEKISETIDYVDLYEIVKEEMNQPTPLLEQIGSRIIKRVEVYKEQIGIITLKIRKNNPAIGGDCKYSAIKMSAKY